jgi:RNA polymerase II subunit A-like phosphatase
MQWKKVDESPYRIHSDTPVNGVAGLPETFEGKGYELSSSDDEAAHTETEAEDEHAGASNGVPALTLDTDTDPETEELKKYMPSLDRQDSSPTELEVPDQWDDLDAEFAEFMASGAEDGTETEDDFEDGGYDTDGGDSEAESVRNEPAVPDGKTLPSQKKRKADDEEREETSRLQKRKKEALERTSSLTNVIGTVTPSEKADAKEDGVGDGVAEESEGDDDLEAALAAEMERQSEEDGEDGDVEDTKKAE